MIQLRGAFTPTHFSINMTIVLLHCTISALITIQVISGAGHYPCCRVPLSSEVIDTISDTHSISRTYSIIGRKISIWAAFACDYQCHAGHPGDLVRSSALAKSFHGGKFSRSMKNRGFLCIGPKEKTCLPKTRGSEQNVVSSRAPDLHTYRLPCAVHNGFR